jgi:hypothetical protein
MLTSAASPTSISVLLSGATVAGGLLVLTLFLVLLGRELVFASDEKPGREIGSINAALVPLLAAFVGVLVIEAANIMG